MAQSLREFLSEVTRCLKTAEADKLGYASDMLAAIGRNPDRVFVGEQRSGTFNPESQHCCIAVQRAAVKLGLPLRTKSTRRRKRGSKAISDNNINWARPLYKTLNDRLVQFYRKQQPESLTLWIGYDEAAPGIVWIALRASVEISELLLQDVTSRAQLFRFGDRIHRFEGNPATHLLASTHPQLNNLEATFDESIRVVFPALCRDLQTTMPKESGVNSPAIMHVFALSDSLEHTLDGQLSEHGIKPTFKAAEVIFVWTNVNFDAIKRELLLQITKHPWIAHREWRVLDAAVIRTLVNGTPYLWSKYFGRDKEFLVIQSDDLDFLGEAFFPSENRPTQDASYLIDGRTVIETLRAHPTLRHPAISDANTISGNRLIFTGDPHQGTTTAIYQITRERIEKHARLTEPAQFNVVLIDPRLGREAAKLLTNIVHQVHVPECRWLFILEHVERSRNDAASGLAILLRWIEVFGDRHRRSSVQVIISGTHASAPRVVDELGVEIGTGLLQYEEVSPQYDSSFVTEVLRTYAARLNWDAAQMLIHEGLEGPFLKYFLEAEEHSLSRMIGLFAKRQVDRANEDVEWNTRYRTLLRSGDHSAALMLRLLSRLRTLLGTSIGITLVEEYFHRFLGRPQFESVSALERLIVDGWLRTEKNQGDRASVRLVTNARTRLLEGDSLLPSLIMWTLEESGFTENVRCKVALGSARELMGLEGQWWPKVRQYLWEHFFALAEFDQEYFFNICFSWHHHNNTYSEFLGEVDAARNVGIEPTWVIKQALRQLGLEIGAEEYFRQLRGGGDPDEGKELTALQRRGIYVSFPRLGKEPDSPTMWPQLRDFAFAGKLIDVTVALDALKDLATWARSSCVVEAGQLLQIRANAEQHEHIKSILDGPLCSEERRWH
jgi:hypothetical protein